MDDLRVPLAVSLASHFFHDSEFAQRVEMELSSMYANDYDILLEHCAWYIVHFQSIFKLKTTKSRYNNSEAIEICQLKYFTCILNASSV